MVQGTDIAATREELNQLRLRESLTYEQLTQLINDAVSGDLDVSSVYRFINEPDRTPFDRTVYKIRTFLDERAKPRRKGGAR